MTESLNGREELEVAALWLAYMNEDINFAITAEEGLKLWRYGRAHPELAEFFDEAEGDDSDWTPAHFQAAIGRPSVYRPDAGEMEDELAAADA